MTNCSPLITPVHRARAAHPDGAARPGYTPAPLPAITRAAPPVRPTWTHRITVLDASGRLHDTVSLTAAGLRAGCGVQLRVADRRVEVTAGDGDAVDARGRMRLTGAVRAGLGWTAGTAVLASARPGVLVLRSTEALDPDWTARA